MKMLKNLFLNVQADSGQTFASTDRHDPYRNFNYVVTITGKKVFAKGGFQKITGLKLKTDVIEYRDGNDKQLTPHKMAGLIKFDPVTFDRGMSDDEDMFNWIYQQAKQNPNDDGHKVTITIELQDRGRQGKKAWELQEAWIADYETGDFDAQGNGVMIERMIIQHEGLKFKKGKSVGGVSGGVSL